MTDTTRQIRLVSRPKGWPTHDDFELVEVDFPPLRPGQVLVRNETMSVDPYMRGRMNDVKSYIPPFELGEPLQGGAVGRVERSHHPAYREGDYVQSSLGWREYFVSDGSGLAKVESAAGGSISDHLG